MIRGFNLFVVFWVLAGCGGDGNPAPADGGVAAGTQIVVRVDTASMNLMNWIDVLVVEAEGPNGQVEGSAGGFSSVDFPVTVGLLPPLDDDDASVRVEARARTGRGNIVRASRSTSFVPGESRLLELELHEACLQVSCENPGETCFAGRCEDNSIQGDTLPLWMQVSGG